MQNVIDLKTRRGILKQIIQHYNFDLNDKGFMLCPFHAEKTPSFSIYEDETKYKCHGCGVQGSVIDFIMQYRGMEFPEACNELEYIINGKRPASNHTNGKNGAVKTKTEKYHIRRIDHSPERFISLATSEVSLSEPTQQDIENIEKILGKKYSLSTLNKANIKINSGKYYGMAFKPDEKQRLIYNPNNNEVFLHLEGRTDYLTAIELGLQDDLCLISEFNKQVKVDVADESKHVFILDSDDTINNKASRINNIQNVKIKFVSIPDGYKDLSDYFNIGKCTKDDIINLVSDAREYLPKFIIEKKTEKGIKRSIDLELYNLFLMNLGFYQYKIDEDYILVRINNHRIKEISINEIKQEVFKYFEKEPLAIRSYIKSQTKTLFSKDFITNVNVINPELKKPKEKIDYIYFKNKFVVVEKGSVHVKDYEYLDGVIWENQIINREFHYVENKTKIDNFEFIKFIQNITNKNQERFNAIQTALGYQLHSYQDVAQTKAIIFTDEAISNTDEANGGTGKSLLANSISWFKDLNNQKLFVDINAKKIDLKNPFAFQSVNKETENVLIDDIRKDFNFEDVFSCITNGLWVEKKNKNPFKRYPKFIVTSNYPIKGSGESFKRRKEEYEIASYYNSAFSPEDEFKRKFFVSWNNEDWNIFDNFMILCIQKYFEHGLLPSLHINIEKKKIAAETSNDFIEYMQEFKPDILYDIKGTYNKFKENYGSTLKQGTFTTWLQKYCKYSGYKWPEKIIRAEHGGKTRLFKFISNNKKNDEPIKPLKEKLPEEIPLRRVFWKIGLEDKYTEELQILMKKYYGADTESGIAYLRNPFDNDPENEEVKTLLKEIKALL